MVAQKPKVKRRVPRKAQPLKPLGQAMEEIARQIPPEAWEGFPRDASKRLDEYLESGKFDS